MSSVRYVVTSAPLPNSSPEVVPAAPHRHFAQVGDTFERVGSRLRFGANHRETALAASRPNALKRTSNRLSRLVHVRRSASTMPAVASTPGGASGGIINKLKALLRSCR